MARRKRKRKVFLRRMRKTLLFVMLMITAALVFLGATLVYINRTKGSRYEKEVLSQKNYSSITVPYRRGDILDCNGTVLATSNKVYNLVIEPKNIISEDIYREATTAALVRFFGLTRETIDEYLKDEKSLYSVVKKGLSYDEVKAFREFDESDEGDNIIGVWFEENYVRDYPYDEVGCHLLGFVVGGNEGLGGLEGSYNEELNGTNGRTYAYLNDAYNLVRTTEPATNGYNIITTIDVEVQKIVQENVQELQKTLNAKNVSVLVMKPDDCSVLALYNDHQYDPNDAFDLECVKYLHPEMSEEEFKYYIENGEESQHLDDLNTLWRSFAVSDTFEPGSTYKTFVLAGALENGVVQPDDTFYCDGHQQVADYDMYCSNHAGHGTLDLSGALAQSCNDAFMQIGELMGVELFCKNQTTFGFGQRTNIDIYGEMDNQSLSYLIYDEKRMNEVELACSAYGQGVNVTMLQLYTAFCSAINGGYYYQPHIVKNVVDEDGNLIENYDKVLVRRTISEETSAMVRDKLHGVVENGTGWRTQMEGYTTGGKTGTAEKLPRNNGKFILSFIGFAPVEDPEVVIYVLVDEPGVAKQDESSGATVLWGMIAEDLFPYMNIYKTGDDSVATEGEDEAVSQMFVDGSPTDDDLVPAGQENVNTGEDASGDDASGDDASGDDASGDDASGDDASGDDASVDKNEGDGSEDAAGAADDASGETGQEDGSGDSNRPDETGGDEAADDSGGDDSGGEENGDDSG